MYEILLYNFSFNTATEVYIADITPMCKNVVITDKLNRACELTCTLPLWEWKRFCQRQGIDPYISIRPWSARIKVKKDNAYLPVMFEINASPKSYRESGSSVNITARGLLYRLGMRLVTKSYTAIDSATIARDLIDYTQAKSYGDLGITHGNAYTTGVPSIRNHTRYKIKDALENLSDDESGGFDFYFDHLSAMYIEQQRGSLKDDTIYKFGDGNDNLLSFDNPEDGNNLYNSVTAVGEGIGDPIVQTAEDTPSKQNNGLMEIALVQSSIDNTAWLLSQAQAELRDRKDMFDLPRISVSPEFFDITTKWVGDTIPIICTDSVSPYIGYGRIQKLSIRLDDNHYESSIDLECVRA